MFNVGNFVRLKKFLFVAMVSVWGAFDALAGLTVTGPDGECQLNRITNKGLTVVTQPDGVPVFFKDFEQEDGVLTATAGDKQYTFAGDQGASISVRPAWVNFVSEIYQSSMCNRYFLPVSVVTEGESFWILPHNKVSKTLENQGAATGSLATLFGQLNLNKASETLENQGAATGSLATLFGQPDLDLNSGCSASGLVYDTSGVGFTNADRQERKWGGDIAPNNAGITSVQVQEYEDGQNAGCNFNRLRGWSNIDLKSELSKSLKVTLSNLPLLFGEKASGGGAIDSSVASNNKENAQLEATYAPTGGDQTVGPNMSPEEIGRMVQCPRGEVPVGSNTDISADEAFARQLQEQEDENSSRAIASGGDAELSGLNGGQATYDALILTGATHEDALKQILEQN